MNTKRLNEASRDQEAGLPDTGLYIMAEVSVQKRKRISVCVSSGKRGLKGLKTGSEKLFCNLMKIVLDGHSKITTIHLPSTGLSVKGKARVLEEWPSG